MADQSPQVKVDVPFKQGLIPPDQLRVVTNFLGIFVRVDGTECELSRVYGTLSDVTLYLLKHWNNDPARVLEMVAQATTYGG